MLTTYIYIYIIIFYIIIEQHTAASAAVADPGAAARTGRGAAAATSTVAAAAVRCSMIIYIYIYICVYIYIDIYCRGGRIMSGSLKVDTMVCAPKNTVIIDTYFDEKSTFWDQKARRVLLSYAPANFLFKKLTFPLACFFAKSNHVVCASIFVRRFFVY